MGLYERHNYTNKDIDFIISTEIIEYDMVSAGLNICKEFKLLPENEIKELEELPKKLRVVRLGLLQKSHKDLVKLMNEGFKEARKRFFEANNITNDDVISIKKDAIFVTKRCKQKQFGHLKFEEKNVYTSYYRLDDKEFYFNNKKGIDIKGISDDLLKYHRDYMLKFLHRFFYMNETSRTKDTIKFLNEFTYDYKTKQLPVGFYRELNRECAFRTYESIDGKTVGLKSVSEKEFDMVDISYNYFKYLVPMIQILM